MLPVEISSNFRPAKWGSRSCQFLAVFLGLAAITLSTFYDTVMLTRNAIYQVPMEDISMSSIPTSGTSQILETNSPLSSSCSCAQFPSRSNRISHQNASFQSFPYITLEQAYFQKMRTTDVSQIVEKIPMQERENFKSQFLPNTNFMNYPLLAMEKVCMDPTGALLLIGTSQEEIEPNITGKTAISELYYLWREIYNCSGNISSDHCVGVTYSEALPLEHSYVPGNTAHFLPYTSNPMHNWAERTWPFTMASTPPIQHTVPFPISHYIIHRFGKWLLESQHSPDRAQMLWQFRMLMEISGDSSPDYLTVKNQSKPVCFDRLLLQMHTRDRIDETRIPDPIAGAGVRKYRAAIYDFFKFSELPQVKLPPEKLRVVYYGRNDTSRRRVMNSEEVIKYLRNFTRPPLEVYYLDEMLASGKTNYSFPEVVRLMSQTDIFVVAHGANTWSTFLLPDGAGVVEIIGPCNWSSYNYSDLRTVHTWMHVNAVASRLKHDTSNPFEDIVPNPRRGNTTLCKNPYTGVPDYTIDLDKLGDVIHSFAYPDRPGDHLTQHWLYDWDSSLV